MKYNLFAFHPWHSFYWSIRASRATSIPPKCSFLSVYILPFVKIWIFFKFTGKCKNRLHVLLNNMGSNHDEKMVEPNMKSRNTGLSNKIMKPKKNIKSWNPDPRKLKIHLKIACTCANDYCSWNLHNTAKCLVWKKHLLSVLGIVLGLNFQK